MAVTAITTRSLVRLAAQAASRRSIVPASASASFAITGARCQQQQRQVSTNILRTTSRQQAAVLLANGRPRTAAAVLGNRAYYSQDAAAPPEGSSKIWSFDEIKALASAAEGDKSVIIVDAREPGELQSTGRIPGAINIPITTSPDSFHITEDEFEDRFGYPRPPKDAEVVFYCKAGVRSRAASQLARSASWTKTGEYPGSWLDWVEKGGKIQR